MPPYGGQTRLKVFDYKLITAPNLSASGDQDILVMLQKQCNRLKDSNCRTSY